MLRSEKGMRHVRKKKVEQKKKERELRKRINQAINSIKWQIRDVMCGNVLMAILKI